MVNQAEKINTIKFEKELNTETEIKIDYLDLVLEDIKNAITNYSEKYNGIIKEKKFLNLRLSQIGKAPIILALENLNYKKEDEKIDQIYPLLEGHFFEAWAKALLFSKGYSVTDSQKSVEFYGVEGHLDGVLKIEEKTYVVEFKSMSESYFRQIFNNPLSIEIIKNEYRGYIKQLACYQEAMQADGAFWVIWDKGSRQIKVIELPEDVKNQAVFNCKNIINVIKRTKTLKEVFDNFIIPEPTPQIKWKRQTGKYLVPLELKYTNWAEVFYEIFSEDGTDFVVRVRSKEEIISLIEKTYQITR
jgi:hypothetical protein